MCNTDEETSLRAQTRALARMARDEDLGPGDITSQLIAENTLAEFRLVAQESGVFAGRVIAADVLGVYDDSMELDWLDSTRDGARIQNPPADLSRIRGPLRTVLAAERVLLNFLQRLCGVATLTRAYVDAIAGTGAEIYDTRKTTPGWRVLEKYAVRCGGGKNHRMGLYDAILLKDNHLAGVGPRQLAGVVFDMLNNASSLGTKPSFVEVEVDTLEQLGELLKVVGIDVILLDNFTVDQLRSAVSLRDGLNLRDKVALEASGGVNLETVRAIAETGVERVSVGAITHSAPALDLSLERV